MAKFRFVLALGAVALVTWLIVESGANAFSRKPPADGAPAELAVDANSVWITRPDGGKSCSPDSAQSLDQGAEDLKKAHVRVLDSRKGGDGKMHAQMCGLPTGTTNAYLVPKDDLAQASALGYVKAP